MFAEQMPDIINIPHERLKMELRLRGKSIASIARELDVFRSSVTLVSQGKSAAVIYFVARTFCNGPFAVTRHTG